MTERGWTLPEDLIRRQQEELAALQATIAQHGQERRDFFQKQAATLPEKVVTSTTEGGGEGLTESMLEILAEKTKKPMTPEEKESYLKQFQRLTGGGEWLKETQRTELGYNITTYLPLTVIICMQTCNTVHDLDGKTILGQREMYFVGQILNNLGIGLKSTSCSSDVYKELKSAKDKPQPEKPAQNPTATSTAPSPESTPVTIKQIFAQLKETRGIPIYSPFRQEPYFIKPEDIKPPLTEEDIQQLVLIQEFYYKAVENQGDGKNLVNFKQVALLRGNERLLNHFGVCCITQHTYIKEGGKRLYIMDGSKKINVPSYKMVLDLFNIQSLDPKRDVCPTCKSIELGG